MCIDELAYLFRQWSSMKLSRFTVEVRNAPLSTELGREKNDEPSLFDNNNSLIMMMIHET